MARMLLFQRRFSRRHLNLLAVGFLGSFSRISLVACRHQVGADPGPSRSSRAYCASISLPKGNTSSMRRGKFSRRRRDPLLSCDRETWFLL